MSSTYLSHLPHDLFRSSLSTTTRASSRPRVAPRTRAAQCRHFVAVMPARDLQRAAEYGFSLSPMPKNPLGDGQHIRTAAALIIGDEILNGKTLDQNSHYFAKYCFEHGIQLKRVEVIADDENEIIEASRRMVKEYDWVITSGGIGPTHDDITYECLAKAFGQKLVHHDETLRRLDRMNQHRPWLASQTLSQREATKRMALFPDRAEVLFVSQDIWVPVVRLEGTLCILPGIPRLFQVMLNGLTQFIPLPPPCDRPKRIQIFTDRAESMIAPYLTSLQARLKPQGIQVGSYPVLSKGVFVSLIGRSAELTLLTAAREVEAETNGKIVSEEDVIMLKNGASAKRATNFTCTAEHSNPPIESLRRVAKM